MKVKLVAMVMVLLGGCVADDTTAPPEILRDEAVSVDEIGQEPTSDDNTGALCELASTLPSTDVCSLVCDPDGFKARLADNGMKSGNCYQVRCNLSPEVSVTVGVCLP